MCVCAWGGGQEGMQQEKDPVLGAGHLTLMGGCMWHGVSTLRGGNKRQDTLGFHAAGAGARQTRAAFCPRKTLRVRLRPAPKALHRFAFVPGPAQEGHRSSGRLAGVRAVVGPGPQAAGQASRWRAPVAGRVRALVNERQVFPHVVYGPLRNRIAGVQRCYPLGGARRRVGAKRRRRKRWREGGRLWRRRRLLAGPVRQDGRRLPFQGAHSLQLVREGHVWHPQLGRHVARPGGGVGGQAPHLRGRRKGWEQNRPEGLRPQLESHSRQLQQHPSILCRKSGLAIRAVPGCKSKTEKTPLLSAKRRSPLDQAKGRI